MSEPAAPPPALGPVPERTATTGVVAIVLGLLALAWCAAPVLAYAAAIMGTSFFGVAPSADQRATSQQYLIAAAVCGLGAPFAGLVISQLRGLRALAVLFAALLALTLGAIVLLAVL